MQYFRNMLCLTQLVLVQAAEKAKIELSSSLQTDINLPYITMDATGCVACVSLLRWTLSSLAPFCQPQALEHEAVPRQV